MVDSGRKSRLNKFEKRRKNTKLISILVIAAGVLLVVLLGFWLFGGGNEEQDEQEKQENNEAGSDFLEIEESEDDPADENEGEEGTEEENGSDSSEEENEDPIQTEPAEPSDDNVAEAYTGNWPPVGTEQEGPHTTNFEDGSQDRIEIREAVLMATGLTADDYLELWIGNGGDQKVEATVANSDQSEIYRVYLSWIDGEGWQPTKVEVLIENDL